MQRIKKQIVSSLTLVVFFLYSPVHFVKQHISALLGLKSPHAITFTLPEVYAAVLTTIQEVLSHFFKEGEVIVEEKRSLTPAELQLLSERADLDLNAAAHTDYLFYVARKGDEVVGYVSEDAVPGKWGLIYYAIHFSPEGKVNDVVVTQYSEKRGKPVAKKRFLKQFRGKGSEDQIKLMKDIKGVTGASMSSSGMTNGIRKMVHVFDLLYGENA